MKSISTLIVLALVSLNVNAHPTTLRGGNPNPHIIIPVVVHILYAYGASSSYNPNDAQLPPGPYGIENISDSQARSAIKVLNIYFNKQNSDTNLTLPVFKPIAANCNFEFRLATIDPNGKCTNGIEHIFTYSTFAADDSSKIHDWPRNRYLNIWVVTSVGTNGLYSAYTYFPSDVANAPWVDGIMIDNQYFGNIGTGSVSTQQGIINTMGKFLNLERPWGIYNGPGVACGDDGVADTPPTEGFEWCPGSAFRSVLNQSGTAFTSCPHLTFPNFYTFSNVSASSGTTAIDTVLNTGAVFGKFKAVNVSANSTVAGKFAFNKWDTGAHNNDTGYSQLTGHIDTSKYYSVTISPAPIIPGVQYILNLSSFSFHVQRNATGVRTFAVRSSIDNFTTNLQASTVFNSSSIRIPDSNIFFIRHDATGSIVGNTITLGSITATTGNYVNITSPVTFRFYGWNAEDSTGTFSIDSVQFTGTAYQVQNYQNFMDYTYCSTMFTNGQLARMQASLASDVAQRDTLCSIHTLKLTGVYDTSVHTLCAPKADFSATPRYVCLGTPVIFNNASWGGRATSYAWSFTNAPSTTVENPTVTFTNTGWQTVTFKAYNAAGADSVTRTGFIYVSDPNRPQWWGGFSETFESDSYLGQDNWVSDNQGGDNATFTLNTHLGYNSNHSVSLNDYGARNQQVDALISPSVDLSMYTNTSSLYYNFKYAYATSQPVINNIYPLFDELNVYFSKNCGGTWIRFIQIYNTATHTPLVTAGYWGQPFVPTNASEWVVKSAKVPVAALGAGASSVRFKFEFVAGSNSNNLYLDDINVSEFLATQGNEDIIPSLNIYPNPTNTQATLSFIYNSSYTTTLDVTDILGREVYTILNDVMLTEGTHSYPIDVSKLPKGVYFIRLKANGSVIIRKLIVD